MYKSPAHLHSLSPVPKVPCFFPVGSLEAHVQGRTTEEAPVDRLTGRVWPGSAHCQVGVALCLASVLVPE